MQPPAILFHGTSSDIESFWPFTHFGSAALLVGEDARTYFNRVVGWPEELNYYAHGADTARESYFCGFAARHEDSAFLS